MDFNLISFDKFSLLIYLVWHRGFGGPIAYADLTQHFGFSITSNTQRFNSDEQYKTLLNAVYQCLEKVTNSNAKL